MLRAGRFWAPARVRWYSRGVDAETASYVQRKKAIESAPIRHYPRLGEVRFGDVLRVEAFRRQYEKEDFSQYEGRRKPETRSLEGRIKSVRKSGKGMIFFDLVQDGSKVQVMASNKLTEMQKTDFNDHHNFFRKGDYVTCEGQPSTTEVGELTLKLTKPMKLASPCLHSTQIPERLVNRSLIKSNRVLNYLVDEQAKNNIIMKSSIIQSIRGFLTDKNFLEVQTPILGGYGTGANAEPFKTQAKFLSDDHNLQLRVAPELWLKKMVISGFDKVFEIGACFRNEGVDATHNPEFTSCEFYQSFTTLDELMKMTEELLHEMYSKTFAPGQRFSNSPQKDTLIELCREEYPKYEFIPTLESKTGKRLPNNLTSESLIDYYNSLGLSLPSVKSPASLLDNLSSIYLESISKNTYCPIFIYNQPSALSPLSKSAEVSYGDRSYNVSMRFELFINGKEYVNSYEEENSPFEQAEKFKSQQSSKSEFNDQDSVIPDWQYVTQMEYGLPPTGGWGCGIDRFAMLFSGSDRIEDVLSFGNLKDVIRQ